MEQARCVYDETLSSVPQSTIGTLYSPACLAKSLWTRCKPGVVKGLLQLCKRALDTGHPAHPGRESLNNNIDSSARINRYEMAHLSVRAHREAAVALACAARINRYEMAHLSMRAHREAAVALACAARINRYEMAHRSVRARREAAVALACAGRSPGREGLNTTSGLLSPHQSL